MILEQGYTKLGEVRTIANTPATETLDNIKRNLKREYSRLHELKDFGKIKKEPIALIGGGPSIKYNLDKFKDFDGITLACGSVHDYLKENKVHFEYAAICDPDPIMANYLKHPDVWTTYLVSTGCHEKVFDILEDYDIVMWNCLSDDLVKEQIALEKDFHAVAGGCTVGLRSLSIALMLGYSDIHLFGFDSCISDNKHHAYDFNSNEELGEIYKVKIGTETEVNTDKEYTCAGYHVAQVKHFDDFYAKYNQYFDVTLHGEGLLQDFMKDKIKNTGNKSRALETLITQPKGSMI